MLVSILEIALAGKYDAKEEMIKEVIETNKTELKFNSLGSSSNI